MKKNWGVLLGCLLLLGFVSLVSAHDGGWTVSLSSWDEETLGHSDDEPFKGWATITVTNIMSESWGDFHFEIYEPFTYNVIFPSTPTPVMLDSAMNPYTGYTYAFDGNKKLDFFFYGNPVDPGETVTFKVYTDNTASQHSWFGLIIYPTPVPEPATMILLGLGVLTLKRKK